MMPEPTAQPARVACIDVGSNSIKLLVATLGADGRVIPLLEKTLETRISAGISQNPPRLQREAILRGAESILTLKELGDTQQPVAWRITATSAVRDAANGEEFLQEVRNLVGLQPDILSGDEEAFLIGLGLRQDPALPSDVEGILIDLGGGSLEVIKLSPAAGQKEATARVSLPLGAVRLMEQFQKNPQHPLSPNESEAIRRKTRESLATCGVDLESGSENLLGTGGAVSCARFLCATGRNRTPPENLRETSPRLPRSALEKLCAQVCASTLEERKRLPGMPPARADIMPAALIVLTTVMESCGAHTLHHSFYNLRFGVAAQLLRLR
jgi:exopolyphosphatase / guanosine-5'-triphosphate,3'-diphosphate pyrophosphatase